MTHLYLIRHADAIFDLKDGKYGDLGLSSKGVEQAERLRNRLLRTGEIKPDVFLSSPLQGARQTAAIISPALEQPVIVDDDFEEWRSEDGTIEPDDFMERWRQVPDVQKPFYRWVEGCENWLEFTTRIQLALNRITRQHEGKTIAVACHGGVIQASFIYFFGLSGSTLTKASIEVGNTSITHWFQRESDSRWVLERFNDCHHLLQP